MTPQEKAKELVGQMCLNDCTDENIELVKKYALIAVDYIIKKTRSVDTMPPNCQKIDDNTREYWQEVKQEIQAL
jgi:hypothetical protein